MMPPCRTLVAAACIVFFVVIPTEAGAQVSSDAAAQAQALFDQAMSDMSAGKYPEACPRLEESNRLDPGAGTQYRLAECYEKTGKLASAWSLYRDVESASRQAGKKEREDKAREQAAALEPRLPKIQILVGTGAAGVAGLEVLRNGVPMGSPSWGTKIPVDPGAQRIVVTAPGKKTWERTVDVVEGKVTELHIEKLEDVSVSRPTISVPTAGPASPSPTGVAAEGRAPADGPAGGRLTAAIALGVTGLAGIGVGAALAVVAKSTWDDGISSCDLDKDGKPILRTCDSETTQAGNDAEALAHGATAAFALGGVSLAVAGILLLLPREGSGTARRPSVIAVPMVSNDRAGLVVTGTF